jgi:transposase InsO family protein
LSGPADCDYRTQIALFRHALVRPLVDLEHGELKRELSRIAAKKHKPPKGGQRTVSIATLKRWLKVLREDGFEGLKPALRSDYGKSRVIPEEWIEKAIALRKEIPSRTALVLVEILRRLPGCPAINQHTLDTVLRQRNATRRLMGKKAKRYRRWTARHVNYLWQGDATPGVWIPDPRNPEKYVQTVLFLWIDDVSRLVVHAEFFFDEKLPRMERSLKVALTRRGVPARLYTDQGKVFRAKQFNATLAELGIGLIHTREYTPEGRGKIERIFGVIQEHLYPEINAAKLKTLAELNEALWAWLECVYHQRVHSELEATPLEVYQAGLEHVRPADPVKVGRAFLWRYIRKVSSNGFISLLGNSYSVEATWSGQSLELRLDPFDLSKIDVYRDQRPVARAHVRNLKHSSLIEIEPLQPLPATEPSGVSFLDLLRQEYRQKLARELGPIPMYDALNKKEEDK